MSKIPKDHLGRFFFHFTHIDNLKSIVENGLLCTNSKNKSNIEHTNVASEGIQERRSTMAVPCGSKGVVHDYVPFYFCSVNPMFLSMLYSKNVDQPLIVILAIPIERLAENDAIFTDASANTKELPNFYEDPADLSLLDWSAIDNLKWKSADDSERHRRMAEVLIYNNVSIEDVEYIIVWNEDIKKLVSEIFDNEGVKIPKITYSPFKTKYKFYFTKFMFKGRDGESLVTGPQALKTKLKKTIKYIINERAKTIGSTTYKFENIKGCLNELKNHFCAIPELEGIYGLETVNDVHSNNVSDHTISVINELKNAKYYIEATLLDKRILKLSAYLHDIGKGPASKWNSGKQSAYPDHPVDSLTMLRRILVEDIKDLSDYEIRLICLLVGYHDLIGEIFGKGRHWKQLISVIKSEKELEMLSALNYADVSAINFVWAMEYSSKIKQFKKEILKEIQDND